MTSRRTGIEVEGLKRLQRELRRAGDDLDDLKSANAEAAAIVAAAGQRLAPHLTGRLAASVRGNRAAGRATILAGGASVPYAGPIHWGWPAHNIEPHPFIAQAAQDTEHEWLPAYEHAIEQVADRFGGTY